MPPDGPMVWPICLPLYSGLVRIHPAFRRILHDRGIVGDRPSQRRLWPEFRRREHIGQIVRRVRRRIVHEQVFDLQHETAVGVVDQVGRELAGRGLGLDAGDELTTGRTHHLHFDLGEALVEGLDHLLLHFGEVGGIEHQPSFLLRRGNEFGRPEILRGRRHDQRASKPDRGQDRFHGVSPPLISPHGPRCCWWSRWKASWRRRSARRAALSAPD